jgi:hypothetical protein
MAWPAIILLIFGALAVWAQAPTGSIEGTVLDPTDATVPGAHVVITEEATGRTIRAQTNGYGRYAVVNILPGIYRVAVSAKGFAVSQLRNLTVDAGAVAAGDIALRLGTVEQTVTIQALAITIESARHTVDTIVTASDIQTLPITSRNFLDLAGLVPGVTAYSGAVLDPTKVNTYRAIGISGRVGAGTHVQVDGIDVHDPVSGSTMLNVSSDSVQEFQLSRSSLDLSAPLTSSGTVSVITNGGSNAVHGRAFADFYNQNMSARSNYDATLLPFHQTRAGASTGGPFRKDRVFWFANWDRVYATNRMVSGSAEWPQLNSSQGVPTGVRYLNGRVDWNAYRAVRLFYSFLHDWNMSTNGNLRSPYQNVNWAAQHTVAIDAVQGHWTHSYRFGFVNMNNRVETAELAIPFPRTPQGSPYYLSVGSFSAGPNTAPQKTGQRSLQHRYNGSVFRGRHTVRYGANVNLILTGGLLGPQSPLVSGTYNLPTLEQIVARGGNPQDPLEYPFRSFTIAAFPSYMATASGHGFAYGVMKDTRVAWYVADSYRVRPGLTLNFGLRWDYQPGYFGDRSVIRDPALERWIKGASDRPSYPKDRFSPSFGFAWNPGARSRTVVRGGFSRFYEGNLWNNVDTGAMLPMTFGGAAFGHAFVALPDGIPLDADGTHPDGNYANLEGRRLADVIGTIGQIERRLKVAFGPVKLDPLSGPSAFSATRGSISRIYPGSQYCIPYSLQFNIGLQHELWPETVLTIDYVHNHGVGLPVLSPDFERRRDAGYLDITAARNQVERMLRGRSVDDWIAANPAASIASFGLINDTIWPGRNPDFLAAHFVTGGFSRYRGLQISIKGRQARILSMKDLGYVLAYTFSSSEASGASFNPEALAYSRVSVLNNRHWNSRETFGPNGLDATHSLAIRGVFTTPGGFRLGSTWIFRTPPASSLYIPVMGAATSGSNYLFATDVDGDAVTDLVPGLGAGQYGRRVKSFRELNRLLDAFNRSYAGSLTAHGRALVNAGLFTEAQMKRLGATVPIIPLAPENNPNPWHNLFTTNLRLERPVRFECVRVHPFVQIYNLFNHAPAGPFGGLNGLFGSLNFDYASAPPGRQGSDLNGTYRFRNAGTRQIQTGIRFEF